MKFIHINKIYFVKLLLFVFWSFVIGMVTIGSLPESPLRASHNTKLSLISFLPEGWSFFTRDSRETKTYVYVKDVNHQHYILRNPGDYRGFALKGIKRSSRIQGIEIGELLKRIPSERWVSCDKDIHTFLQEESIEAFEIANQVKTASLCGEIVLERKTPVPWAWSKHAASIHMPSKIVKLNIACN